MLCEEIESSFQVIESVLSDEDLFEFKKSHMKDLSLYHFRLGMWIRNNLLSNVNRLSLNKL